MWTSAKANRNCSIKDPVPDMRVTHLVAHPAPWIRLVFGPEATR